ncbi:MAG: CxxC-x17-CxxC domain-containing protein [archaeon]
MSEKKMYDVKCTECGKDTTVPFEPTKGKPVYCKVCFSKRRSRNRPQRERTPSEPIMFNMKNAWACRGK